MRDSNVATLKWFALIMLIEALFAGRALRAQFNAGSYSSGDSGKLARTLPHNVSTDSTYDVGPFPLYRPALETGEGSREVNTYCNTCHSPRYITMQPPLAADVWTAEVVKMEKTFGAQIPDDVSQKIIRYLQAHYASGTRKH